MPVAHSAFPHSRQILKMAPKVSWQFAHVLDVRTVSDIPNALICGFLFLKLRPVCFIEVTDTAFSA